jgi:DNA-binding MarR family transcriptional regulator
MTQIHLSDAQAVILSAACARDDGAVFPVTTNLKGGAVGNVCKSLLKRGLIEEIEATDLNTVYRHDEDRGPVTLRATPLAYSSLGITDDTRDTAPTETETAPAPKTVRRRTGTKQEAVIAMLRRAEGATIDEIAAATQWAPHTARGFLSGALKKKLGLAITSERVEARGRVYALK